MSLFFPAGVKQSTSSFANSLADRIIRELPQFPNMIKRLRIYSETEKYNWREDESVWAQKRGKTPEEGDVYMDREWVSAYNVKDGENKAFTLFLEGLRDLYSKGKIFINESAYIIKEEQDKIKEQNEKALEIPEARNEIEGMIVESVKKEAKKRRRKIKMV